jgi:hypothetical protein
MQGCIASKQIVVDFFKVEISRCAPRSTNGKALSGKEGRRPK